MKLDSIYCFSWPFFNDHSGINGKLKQALLQYKTIIVSVFHNRHFTIAYTNYSSNTFTYIDPIEKENQLYHNYSTNFKLYS